MLKPKVLVIGDACVDIYVYGQCLRLNPESSAPLLTKQRSEQKSGMALNVRANLEALGCDVVSVTPADLSIKTRYIDSRTGQQLLRLDQDQIVQPVTFNELANIDEYDAVVVSDYNKGFVSETLLSKLDRLTIPVIADTKKTDLSRYQHILFKINNLENGRLIGQPTNLIVTLGDRGASYRGQIYETVISPVVDVCGAGDMFLSALSYQIALGKDIGTAITFANQAASISIQHSGVYVLNRQDVAKLKNG